MYFPRNALHFASSTNNVQGNRICRAFPRQRFLVACSGSMQSGAKAILNFLIAVKCKLASDFFFDD